MAIIENKIQYYWVRNRVAKLHKLIDENTPANSPYRIELELLSKLEKEYSEEYASIIEKEIEVIANNVEKKQINIYEGLPVILEKVKGVALSAVMGKSNAWMMLKLGRYVVKGKKMEFVIEDMNLLNQGLILLGQEISHNLVSYSNDREDVIKQIKSLNRFISMPFIYSKVLKVKKNWFDNRMKAPSKDGKACCFKEEDIHQINMATIQIVNELKSIEFVL